jgi:hypothetical protein
MTDLTTTDVAKRLGVTRRRALGLMTEGRIRGRQLSSGAWIADADSVARFEITASSGSGRTLSVAASWALLWELSGLEVTWLSPSTHARVRRRIRTSTPEQIAQAVASRTREYRCTAANPDRAQKLLISTGRAAIHVVADLECDLADDQRHTCGYVRSGSMEDFAAENFLLPTGVDNDVLYANTLPIAFDGDTMPSAVVAADLSRSPSSRERSAGIRALEMLRQRWLDTHSK